MRRFSTNHYNKNEIKNMSDKEKEKILLRRQKYSDAMNDLKKLRDYYKFILHQKLKKKVDLQHKSIHDSNSIRKNLIEKVEEKKQLSVYIPYTSTDKILPKSKVHRITQIYDQMKTLDLLDGYEEPEFWKFLRNESNLVKIESHLHRKDCTKDLTFSKMKEVCGIPKKHVLFKQENRKKIHISKQKANQQTDTHINSESMDFKIVEFPSLHINDEQPHLIVQENSWIREAQENKTPQKRHLETLGMFSKAETYAQSSQRLLERKYSLQSIDVTDSKITDIFDMQEVRKMTRRSKSLPVEDDSHFRHNDGDTSKECKMNRNDRTKISLRPLRLIHKREIVPLCIDDLEKSCPVIESKLEPAKSNFWTNTFMIACGKDIDNSTMRSIQNTVSRLHVDYQPPLIR